MLNKEKLSEFFDSTEEEHCRHVDQVVTSQMYALGETMPVANLGEVISEIRSAAIKATLESNPELAALFIRLGAELIATTNDGTIGCVVTRPSKAIPQIIALA